MPTPATIGERYRVAVASFIDVARTFEPSDWQTVVPCTPAWTARDVLSHVSGIPDDAIGGRMAGAPGEAWTAAQIERNRDADVEELLDRWARQTPVFAEMLDQIGETRPPIDCHSHEHDLRHALGRPGNRSNELVEFYGRAFATFDDLPVRFVVDFDDERSVVSGDADASTTVTLGGVSTFELLRSRLGRRTRDQVLAYDWAGEPAAVEQILDRWFAFGPAEHPIHE
jgi:uncharacterized protein (TIGR03083 family)